MVMSRRLSSAKEHSLLLLREVMNDIDSHGKGILDFQRASTDKQRQRLAIPRLPRATCCKESACVKLRLREADGQVGSSAFDRVLV